MKCDVINIEWIGNSQQASFQQADFIAVYIWGGSGTHWCMWQSLWAHHNIIILYAYLSMVLIQVEPPPIESIY